MTEVSRQELLEMTQANSLDDSAQAAGGFDRSTDKGIPDPAVLAELRRDLAAIVADVREIVARRAVEASTLAQDGMTQTVDAARSSIRTHPFLAIGIAVLMGAGAAVALTAVAGPSRQRQRAPSLPERAAGFIHSASEFPGTVLNSPTISSWSTAFERLVEAISTIDPKSPLGPTWGKASSWLSDLKSALFPQ
jgi:hypothetical protein